MVRPRPHRWLDDLKAYVPGKTGAANSAKLSSNENPLGPSPKVLAAMRDALASVHRYADGGASALRQAIGDRYAIDPSRIVCGTGSDELLQLTALAFAAPGDEILYVNHGFMVYPIAARRVGAHPVAAPDADYTADVDALLAHVSGKTRVLFLANPNNPTGTYLPKREIERLHAALPEHVLLVLDAAYEEYVDVPDYDGGLALALSASNVLHTRTFSKIHALAGERIGWAVGHPDIVAALNKIRGPFNVTTAGQAGAIAALDDADWMAASRQHNRQWRDWLQTELRALGLGPVPSVCNFILVAFPDSVERGAAAANQWLGEHGFQVRYLPGQGLPHCLRISIGTEAEMRGLVTCLKVFLEQ